MRSRALAAIGLACPLVLVAVIVLMRSGVIRFANDFTGFRGLGFVISCLAVLVPVGLVASLRALWLDQRSPLARASAAVNTLLAVGAMLLIGQLMF
jgi:hypothetical protein